MSGLTPLFSSRSPISTFFTRVREGCGGNPHPQVLHFGKQQGGTGTGVFWLSQTNSAAVREDSLQGPQKITNGMTNRLDTALLKLLPKDSNSGLEEQSVCLCLSQLHPGQLRGGLGPHVHLVGE